MKASHLEIHAKMLLDEISKDFVPEYKFDSKRRWRFDFAHIGKKIAIEVEGGVWSGGRHTRGLGYTKDCEKYNEATMQGWKVLRFTNDMILDGSFQESIKRILI